MAGPSSDFADDDSSALSSINVVPLVDVVLVLLIVFMITVPAIVGSAPIKVDLPETVSAAMAADDSLPLHLFLRREQEGKVVLYLNSQPTTEAALRSLLKEGFSEKEKPTTFLAADRTLPYEEVIKVVDMLHSIGLNKLSLDTKHVTR